MISWKSRFFLMAYILLYLIRWKGKFTLEIGSICTINFDTFWCMTLNFISTSKKSITPLAPCLSSNFLQNPVNKSIKYSNAASKYSKLANNSSQIFPVCACISLEFSRFLRKISDRSHIFLEKYFYYLLLAI